MVLIAWFAYIATLSSFFRDGPISVTNLLCIGACRAADRHPGPAERNSGRPIFNHLRDWTPLAFTLVAFREMDWFTPARYCWNGSIYG